MTITEDSAFILTRIAELTRELDSTVLMQEASIIVFVVCIAIAVAGHIAYKRWASKAKFYESPPIYANADWVMCVVAGVVVLVIVATTYEIPFIESELDSLVTAYEALYGPIPEGML